MIKILIAKSSSGKDYILKHIVSNGLATPIISYTSRPIRDGEKHGVDYYYTTTNIFENMIDNHELIEYRKYNTLVDNKPATWYYGMRRQKFDKNKNYIVILDVGGANEFIKQVDNCEVYFIEADDNLRTQWAMKRGSFDKYEWERRMKDDDVEISEDKLSDYVKENVKINHIKNYGQNIELIVDKIMNEWYNKDIK